MGQRLKRSASAEHGAEPLLITDWEDFVVEDGVMFVRFWSGSKPYCLAMGPAMAFDAIDRARQALQRGIVEKLLGEERDAH